MEETKKCPHCQKDISSLATKCPYCQSKVRPKNDRWKLVGTAFAVILGLMVLIAIMGAASGGSHQSSPSVANSSTPQTPTDIVCGMSPQDLRAKATTVDYKQLVKDPSSFQGTFTKFNGQILEIEQSGNTGVMRLSVTNEGYGVWSPNDVVYVEYSQATKAVQDDVVTVYGMLKGTQTYTSQANYQITIPDLVACAIGAIPAPASSSTSASTNSTQQAAHATAPATIPTVHPQPSTPTPAPTQTYTTPSGVVVNGSGVTVSVPTMWHTAFTYSDTSSATTQPFSLQATQWRITYTCTLTNPSFNSSFFGGYVNSVDNSVTQQFVNSNSCPTTKVSYIYSQPAGQYYLDTNTANISYTITVEDYY